MDGKSSRGRNKKGSQNAATNAVTTAATNATEQVVASNGHPKENVKSVVEEQKVDANGVRPSVEIVNAQPEVKELEYATSENQVKQDSAQCQPLCFWIVTREIELD